MIRNVIQEPTASGTGGWKILVGAIGSMVLLYGNSYHQYTPNVSIYTSTMDPMGIATV